MAVDSLEGVSVLDPPVLCCLPFECSSIETSLPTADQLARL